MREDAAGDDPDRDDPPETNEGGTRRPLQLRAFRAYFFGQLASNTGSWFQNLAISLVVLQQTGSASALSWVTIAQFTPIFLLSPLAGWLADNVPIRRILICTSCGSFVTSSLLIVVVTRNDFDLASVLSVVAFSGTFQAMERIAAQSFVYELVGKEMLKPGTVIASAINSVARSIGPGLAGLTFATFGPATCLSVNALSYVAVIIAMILIRPSDLHPRRRVQRDRPRIRFRDVPMLQIIVLLLCIQCCVTVAAMNMNIVLTTLVTETLNGGADHLGVTHALNAVGSVAAAVILSRMKNLSFATLVPACLVFAIALTVNALAPSVLWLLLLAPILGVGIGMFNGTVNAVAQSSVPPPLIGRMMSLAVMVMYGSVPAGALLSGWLIDTFGGRAPFLVGAAVCALAAAVALWVAKAKPGSGTDRR